jgi:hypothetical protein
MSVVGKGGEKENVEDAVHDAPANGMHVKTHAN